MAVDCGVTLVTQISSFWPEFYVDFTEDYIFVGCFYFNFCFGYCTTYALGTLEAAAMMAKWPRDKPQRNST